MKPIYLLDTVILIDHLNGIPKATKWLKSVEIEKLAISVITRAEVLTGTSKSEYAAVNLMLDRFKCFHIDSNIANETAKLRKENRWKLPDAFQAAIAIQHSLKLVTRNTKDFTQEKYPFVIIPYNL